MKTSWNEAINLIGNKIKNTDKSKIAGYVGDLASLETIYSFKQLFKNFGSENLDIRERNFYINPKDKMNYIFNSSIKGIEETDFLLLIGCNPRHEATMVNARIRKAYLKNKFKIFSLGDPGDLTYPYQKIGESTKDLKTILEKNIKSQICFNFSKRPIIIIGESRFGIKVRPVYI